VILVAKPAGKSILNLATDARGGISGTTD